MELNYWWLSLFFLLLAALVIWLVKRDRKDEKVFEKELNRPEDYPEDGTKF
jgi:membrane protein implicated in regulation of membrane protease activity